MTMNDIERDRAISAEYRMAIVYAKAGNDEGVKSCQEQIRRLEEEGNNGEAKRK